MKTINNLNVEVSSKGRIDITVNSNVNTLSIPYPNVPGITNVTPYCFDIYGDPVESGDPKTAFTVSIFSPNSAMHEIQKDTKFTVVVPGDFSQALVDRYYYEINTRIPNAHKLFDNQFGIIGSGEMTFTSEEVDGYVCKVNFFKPFNDTMLKKIFNISETYDGIDDYIMWHKIRFEIKQELMHRTIEQYITMNIPWLFNPGNFHSYTILCENNKPCDTDSVYNNMQGILFDLTEDFNMHLLIPYDIIKESIDNTSTDFDYAGKINMLNVLTKMGLSLTHHPVNVLYGDFHNDMGVNKDMNIFVVTRKECKHSDILVVTSSKLEDNNEYDPEDINLGVSVISRENYKKANLFTYHCLDTKRFKNIVPIDPHVTSIRCFKDGVIWKNYGSDLTKLEKPKSAAHDNRPINSICIHQAGSNSNPWAKPTDDNLYIPNAVQIVDFANNKQIYNDFSGDTLSSVSIPKPSGENVSSITKNTTVESDHETPIVDPNDEITD